MSAAIQLVNQSLVEAEPFEKRVEKAYNNVSLFELAHEQRLRRALGYIAEPRSIYETVSRLPAGSCLTIKRGRRPVLKRYWDPVPTTTVTGNINDVADELIARLSSSVQSQLVSDVPIGAFLSGGVDSSGTMALMAKASPAPKRSMICTGCAGDW